MRRIGQYKADSHAAAQRETDALPLWKRLQRGWALYERHRTTGERTERIDDPSEFYAKAKRLGLYRVEDGNS